jgi:hypothetical protein
MSIVAQATTVLVVVAEALREDIEVETKDADEVAREEMIEDEAVGADKDAVVVEMEEVGEVGVEERRRATPTMMLVVGGESRVVETSLLRIETYHLHVLLRNVANCARDM